MNLDGKTVEIWYEKKTVSVPNDVEKVGEAIMYTGKTFAVIWDGAYRYVGISECSEADLKHFSRKKGRHIALSRAKFIQTESGQNVLPKSIQTLARRNNQKYYLAFELGLGTLPESLKGVPEHVYKPQERKKPDVNENRVG